MVDLFYKLKDSNFASYADDTTVVYYRATKKKSPPLEKKLIFCEIKLSSSSIKKFLIVSYIS